MEDPEPNYSCDVCSKRFINENEFNDHKDKDHPISCHKCKLSFDFSVDLTVHIAKKHKISNDDINCLEKSESPFRCRICLKNFMDINKHSQYHCENCDNLLADVDSLKAHKESCERKMVYFWKYKDGCVIKQCAKAN